MLRPQSTALVASRFLLQFLRALNLVAGVMLLLALPASFLFDAQFSEFFSKRPPRLDPGWLLPILRVWFVLALPMIGVVHVMFSRLLAVVGTVGLGDPFVPENAARLLTIARCLLAIELFRLACGAMAGAMNAAGSNIDWQFSLSGWLAVALVFVLAWVFEEGTRMRADLGSMI